MLLRVHKSLCLVMSSGHYLTAEVLGSRFSIALKHTIIKHITTYTAIRGLVVSGVGAVSH